MRVRLTPFSSQSKASGSRTLSDQASGCFWSRTLRKLRMAVKQGCQPGPLQINRKCLYGCLWCHGPLPCFLTLSLTSILPFYTHGQCKTTLIKNGHPGFSRSTPLLAEIRVICGWQPGPLQIKRIGSFTAREYSRFCSSISLNSFYILFIHWSCGKVDCFRKF